MAALVSNRQGEELARIARGLKISREVLQSALDDGTLEGSLRELKLRSLEYPEGPVIHLTPLLEATEVCSPGKTEIWESDLQERGNIPPGEKIYEILKKECLLGRCLSFAELKFFEGRLDRVPHKWRQSRVGHSRAIYAWASVVWVDSRNALKVPCLICDENEAWVEWRFLRDGFGRNQLTALRR